MDKPKESKNINDIHVIKEPNISENKEDIITDTKLESIYFNLLNNTKITLPKINGFQNFMAFFNYIFTKLNTGEESPDKTGRKNELLKVLIEQLTHYSKELGDSTNQAKIEQYFYDKNFFGVFLEILNKKEDISSFKEIFLLFSKVSILYYIYLYFIFQIIQNALKDNLDINNLFREKIINELFNQYDSFKNIEEKDLQEKINFNKQKSININIIEKIKVIFDEFKNNPNENIQNILVYIDNLFQNIRINIKLDFNDITNTTKINESIIEKINKDIQKIQNELQIEKNNSLNIINKENKKIELGVKILKENENENNEGVGLSPNKKEKKFTGKKRTRERKIINNHTQIIWYFFYIF